MRSRAFRFLTLLLAWAVLVSVIVVGTAVASGARHHPLIFPAVITLMTVAFGCLLREDGAYLRTVWWPWRTWWWHRRTGRWLARRDALRARGMCPSCGYDLRASRRQCPECGENLSGPGLPPASP